MKFDSREQAQESYDRAHDAVNDLWVRDCTEGPLDQIAARVDALAREVALSEAERLYAVADYITARSEQALKLFDRSDGRFRVESF